MEDYRKLEDEVSSIKNRVVELEKSSAISHVEFLSVKNDLSDIKESLSWVIKLIIGALILAIIGFALGGGLVLV